MTRERCALVALIALSSALTSLYGQDAPDPLWERVNEGHPFSSPVASCETLYVGSEDHSFYAFSKAHQEILWSYETGGPISGAPLLTDRYVYFRSANAGVYKVQRESGELAWHFVTGSSAEMDSSSPVRRSGRVYFGSAAGHFYCVNDSNGVEIWRFTAGGRIRSTPVFADGKILFGCDGPTLYALDEATGVPVWQADVTVDDPSQTTVEASPVVYGDFVLMGFRNGQVHGFDLNTGEVRWTLGEPGPAGFDSTGLIVNDRLYIGSSDTALVRSIDPLYGLTIRDIPVPGRVYGPPVRYKNRLLLGMAGVGDVDETQRPAVVAINGPDGRVSWTLSLDPDPDVPSSTPGVSGRLHVHEDRLYVSDRQGGLHAYALDPQIHGRETNSSVAPVPRWEFHNATGEEFSSPVYDCDAVYVGSEDHSFYAIGTLSQEVLWSFPTGDRVIGAPLVTEGFVYFPSDDRNLYKVNRHNGELVWAFMTAPGEVTRDIEDGETRFDYHSSTPVLRDGRLYFGSTGGVFYCVEDSNATEIWSFPSGGRIRSTPAFADGKVFFGSHGPRVFALDELTGALVWEADLTTTEINRQAAHVSPVIYEDLVIMGFRTSQMHGFDLQTGEIRWTTFGLGTSWVESTGRIINGLLYHGSSFARVVRCLRPGTGQILWSQPAPGLTYGTASHYKNAVIFGISGVSGNFAEPRVAAFDLNSGKSLWDFTLGYTPKTTSFYTHGVPGHTQVVGDVLYFSDREGGVYAYDLDPITPATPPETGRGRRR